MKIGEEWRRNKIEKMMEMQERGRESWDRWRGRWKFEERRRKRRRCGEIRK